ncbi:hypothetical protein FOE78_21045 [Microlunatus elymi]|uniref:Uncharacterized protein n=1 Tax=Microlunatus elymi TaxID=2596828 RepID=A0A516Q3Q2_9ACTN|nr:hypothetical protein [Microlunatus elymi]QDP98055.1 hypothetical protein FOE78_21045 [Microlunatus elymi]
MFLRTLVNARARTEETTDEGVQLKKSLRSRGLLLTAFISVSILARMFPQEAHASPETSSSIDKVQAQIQAMDDPVVKEWATKKLESSIKLGGTEVALSVSNYTPASSATPGGVSPMAFPSGCGLYVALRS